MRSMDRLSPRAQSWPLSVSDDDGPILHLTINASVIQETGSTLGTVARNTPAPHDLVVTLVSSTPPEAPVPAIVTIPTGQSSASLTISGATDNLPDGVKHVTITASAAGCGSGAAGLDVT